MKAGLCLLALLFVAHAGFLGTSGIHSLGVLGHRSVGAHLDDATLVGVLSALDHGHGHGSYGSYHHGGGIDDGTLVAALVASQSIGHGHGVGGHGFGGHGFGGHGLGVGGNGLGVGGHGGHGRGGYLPH